MKLQSVQGQGKTFECKELIAKYAKKKLSQLEEKRFWQIW